MEINQNKNLATNAGIIDQISMEREHPCTQASRIDEIKQISLHIFHARALAYLGSIYEFLILDKYNGYNITDAEKLAC